MSTTIPHLYLHQWIGGVDTVTLAVSDVLNEREPDSVVSRPSSLPAISTELIEELVFLRICEKNKEPSRPIKVGREGGSFQLALQPLALPPLTGRLTLFPPFPYTPRPPFRKTCNGKRAESAPRNLVRSFVAQCFMWPVWVRGETLVRGQWASYSANSASPIACPHTSPSCRSSTAEPGDDSWCGAWQATVHKLSPPL